MSPNLRLDRARARFQRRQRELFRAVGALTRSDGPPEWDPVTGALISGTTVVFDGECLLRAFTWEGRQQMYGTADVRLRHLKAKFPVDTDAQYDDVFVASFSAFDSSLVGVAFRVVDPFRDDWQISRECILQEIIRPKEDTP